MAPMPYKRTKRQLVLIKTNHRSIDSRTFFVHAALTEARMSSFPAFAFTDRTYTDTMDARCNVQMRLSV